MSKKREKAEAFKANVESKIQDLIGEFSEGKISREQFNLLYDRYNGQLSVANEALAENDMRALKEIENSVPTVYVKEATAGKATGMGIYHHKNKKIIEALGTFNIPVALLTPTLNEILGKINANEFVEPKSMHIAREHWVLFESRKYTTIITLFQNEPSPVQIREMQRLHHDFEIANKRFLTADTVDTKSLGYPFLAIVQKSLKQ